MGRNRALGTPFEIATISASQTTEAHVDMYAVNALSGAVTLTLDPNAFNGDQVLIQDVANNAGTQPIVINASPGQTILDGVGDTATINTNGAGYYFTFDRELGGWAIQLVLARGSSGSGVLSVTATAPIQSSGGVNPNISITPATEGAAGSMSAADKTKLDNLTQGVTSVTGVAPIVSSGGLTPAISITAATEGAAGSMSAADKTKLDNLDYPELPGTGTSTYTSAGTIAEIVPTETKLAWNTAYEVDGFAGQFFTTSNTPVTVVPIPIPATGSVDVSISVVAFDSGAAGNVYRADLTFTAATGVFLPASGNPLNVRSAGTVTGWAATLVQSGSTVEVQLAGVSPSDPADPVTWSVIGQVQFDT